MQQRILAPFLILAALLLTGCGCLLSRIETSFSLPEVRPEEKAEIRAVIDRPLPPPLATPRNALNLETAERCDIIDPAHCLFPFPNDYFTREDASSPTGRWVDFDPESMPKNAKGKGVDPEAWKASDGFSPGPLIITHAPGIDLVQSGTPSLENLESSLDPDSPVQLVDAETGERVLLWAELDLHAEHSTGQTLLIRPAVNLVEGRRYVVALQRLKDERGRAIDPAFGFLIYRERRLFDDPRVEKRRAHFEEIFAFLESTGLERDDLYLAWDFTVASRQNHSARLLRMRDDAFLHLGDEAPKFKVSCCDEGYENLARRVWGSYKVPNYLEGKGLPGSRLELGADGLPRRKGVTTAYFSCLIPESARQRPARLMLYGHGTLGSLDEIKVGDVREMAAEYNYVICATNWTGQAATDYFQAYRFLCDASEFPALADRVHQGILNTLFLGRLMKHREGLVSHKAFQTPDGQPLIDTSELYFDGNSQGALLGGTATAISQEWNRAVLGVAGMNYSLILRRSTSFVAEPIPGLPSLGQTFDRAYGELERPLVLALVQMLWDRVDLNGHARHLLGSDDPDKPRKQVLIHVAYGDPAVPNIASEILARTLGLPVRKPIASDVEALGPSKIRREEDFLYPHFQPEIVRASAELPSRVILWDSGACPTPIENFTPAALGNAEDPHGQIRDDPRVMRQKAAFLSPASEFLEVCDEAQPCHTVHVDELEEICTEVRSP